MDLAAHQCLIQQGLTSRSKSNREKPRDQNENNGELFQEMGLSLWGNLLKRLEEKEKSDLQEIDVNVKT